MGKFNLLTSLTLNASGMTAGLAAATTATKEFATNVEAQNAGLSKSFVNVSEMGIGAMRKELMQLNKINFGGKTKEQILEINQRIGDLKDGMGDLKAVQKSLGVELGTQIAGGLQTVAAGAELATGAMTLFGGLSKESADKLQKGMVALIGVTQALGVIEDALATKQLQNIAVRIQATVVTAAQAVATTVAAAAQWVFNAALMVTVGIIGGAVVIIAALAAGIYYLVKALNDDNAEMTASIGILNRVSEAHGSLFKVIKDNALKAQDIHMQNLVATGKITQKDYDLWKALEEKKAAIKEVFQKRSEALYQLWDANEIQKKGKHGADLLKLEQAFEAARMGIIADGNKAAASVTALYDEEVKAINSKTAATVAGGDAYDRLTAKISTLEAKIKATVASGGVVNPEMLNKLSAYRAELAKVNAEVDKLTTRSGVKKMDSIALAKPKTVQGTMLPKSKSNFTDQYDAAKMAKVNKELAKTDMIAGQAQNAIGGLGDAFIQMAQTGQLSFKGLVMSTLDGVRQIINALLAQAIAAQVASNSKAGLPGLIMAGVGIVAVEALFASLPAFANGGIVGGNSFSGDQIHARVNSGEMILNARQQANLFDMASSRRGEDGVIDRMPEMKFRLSGEDIIGAIKRRERRIAHTR